MGKVKDRYFTDEEDKLGFLDDRPHRSKVRNLKEEHIKKRNKLRKTYEPDSRVFVVDQKMYDQQLKKAEEDAENISSRRTDKYLQLMKEHECLCYPKKLVRFPKESIKKIEGLKLKFPNAVAILNSLIAQIHLQQFSNKPYAKIPPLVFVGPPGTGKTALAKKIIEAIAPAYYYLNLSVASEAFYLSGLTLGYDSGTTGEIARILKSRFANTFVVIEEIDKAVSIQNQHRAPPAVPLLDLLEFNSSKQFRDDGLELEFDTSYLSYIFTGNNVDNIPTPLLSRMMIFHINQPTKKQIIQTICDSIWQDILQEETWGHAFSIKLSFDLKERLSNISPRKIKSQLKLAAAYAAQRQKQSTQKIALQLSDIRITSEKKRTIGFI